jgi:predicted anti-sigma-YlaC factor YlaD
VPPNGLTGVSWNTPPGRGGALVERPLDHRAHIPPTVRSMPRLSVRAPERFPWICARRVAVMPGNFRPRRPDNLFVDCKTCREAVSARMDGEQEPVPAVDTDAHLRECAECWSWQARAVEVTRVVRVREVTPTPDLTASILATAPMPVSTRGWWARLALGVVALAQISLGLSQVLGIGTVAEHAGHGGGELSGHLFNESTAWNLALGIGLYWVVFRTSAAAGLIPPLGGFVLVLLGFSTYDLIIGAAPVSRIAEHGVLIAGLVLLVIVHRQHRHPTPGQGDALPDSDATEAPEQTEPTAPDDSGPDDQRPPLRPVGQHRVA